jgi:hypothetical protein
MSRNLRYSAKKSFGVLYFFISKRMIIIPHREVERIKLDNVRSLEKQVWRVYFSQQAPGMSERWQ